MKEPLMDNFIFCVVTAIAGHFHYRKPLTYSELDSKLCKSYHCSLYDKRTGNVYTTAPSYKFPTLYSRWFKSKMDATSWDKVGISPVLFWKKQVWKKCSSFGKNTLIVFSYELKFSFEMYFHEYLGKKLRNFFLYSLSFMCFKWNICYIFLGIRAFC